MVTLSNTLSGINMNPVLQLTVTLKVVVVIRCQIQSPLVRKPQVRKAIV